MEIIIKPRSALSLHEIRDIWNYRELLWTLSWKDFKVRYKQTALGVLWAIFQPLFAMFVFTIFFGNIAKIPSGQLPYPVFVLVGLILWTFFSGTLVAASNSMVENENIIKKVYFPRILLPISKLLVCFIDFLVASSMMLLVVAFFKLQINANILWLLPLGILITSLSATGTGLILASVNVKYRDVRYILPFFIQMLVFFTPVIYPTDIMRPSFAKLMAINPMTGVIESIRSTIAGSAQINWDILLISLISSIVLAISGLIYFKKTERFFADII